MAARSRSAPDQSASNSPSLENLYLYGFHTLSSSLQEGEEAIAALVLTVESMTLSELDPPGGEYNVSWRLSGQNPSTTTTVCELFDATPWFACASTNKNTITFHAAFRMPLTILPKYPCKEDTLARWLFVILQRREQPNTPPVIVGRKKMRLYLKENDTKRRVTELVFETKQRDMSRKVSVSLQMKVNADPSAYLSWFKNSSTFRLALPSFLSGQNVPERLTMPPGQQQKTKTILLSPRTKEDDDSENMTCPRCMQKYSLEDNHVYACTAHTGAPTMHWDRFAQNVVLGTVSGTLIGTSVGAAVVATKVGAVVTVKNGVGGAAVSGGIGGGVGGATGVALNWMSETFSPMRFSCCGRTLNNPICGRPRPHVTVTVEMQREQERLASQRMEDMDAMSQASFKTAGSYRSPRPDW